MEGQHQAGYQEEDFVPRSRATQDDHRGEDQTRGNHIALREDSTDNGNGDERTNLDQVLWPGSGCPFGDQVLGIVGEQREDVGDIVDVVGGEEGGDEEKDGISEYRSIGVSGKRLLVVEGLEANSSKEHDTEQCSGAVEICPENLNA